MENNARRERRGQIQHRPMLDNRKKELMMAALIRNEQAFKAMQENLVPGDFDDYDRPYALVWRLTLEFYQTHGYLPDHEQLSAEVEDADNAAPGQLTNEDISQIELFLDVAYELGGKIFADGVENPKYADWAVKTAKKFLEERLVTKTREGLQPGAMIPVDIPAFLEETKKVSDRISSLTSAGATLSFGDNWDKQIKLEITTTGIPFIDNFLGGGDAPSEVYGVLGPFGSCKTTLAYMLAVNRAYYFQHLLATTGKHKMAVVCSYEAPLLEMRQRSMGYAASIQRDRIEKMDSILDLSTSGCLQDYEQRMFRSEIANGQPVQGEQERVADARRVLDQHLLLLDMTGNEFKGRGGGSFKEAARWMSHEVRQRGGHIEIGLTIFDYVGAMIKRYMAAANKEESLLRQLITGAGLESKNEVGHVFKTPVYLFHQLNGEANKLAEGKLADHTDSAESRSFGENLDFSMSIGRPTVHNVALFGCTKHRRQAPKAHTIIQVNGAMNKVECVDKYWTLDPGTNKIISIEDAEKLRGDDKPRDSTRRSAEDYDNPADPNS